jgi:hypothetical protein
MELKEFVKSKVWVNTLLPAGTDHTFFIFSELP